MNVMLNDLADILDVIADAIEYDDPGSLRNVAQELRKELRDELVHNWEVKYDDWET